MIERRNAETLPVKDCYDIVKPFFDNTPTLVGALFVDK